MSFIQGDFTDEAVAAQLQQALQGRPVDVVLSDMAPNLSGVAVSDAARVALLVEIAVDFARQHLRPEGSLVTKVFHGSGYSQLVELFKKTFRVVKAVKPKASTGQIVGNLPGRQRSEGPVTACDEAAPVTAHECAVPAKHMRAVAATIDTLVCTRINPN